MYEQYYGLSRRPFRAAATGADVFVGPQTAKIMQATKKALASSDAIVAVVGPAGVGKTTLVGHALDAMGGDKQIIRISRMQLGHDEVLEFLLDEMHARNIPASTIKKITLFKKLVAEKAKSGTRLFIVVEDAVRIGDDTLAELEALTAADGHESTGSNMVLMGDNSLRELLSTDSLIRLKQRVRVYQNVNPLIAPELLGYLKHCFRLAGSEFDLKFADGAAQQIHALTGGVPRTTNNLVESVLNAGSERQLAKIDIDLIRSVAEEEFGLTGKNRVIAAAPAEPKLEPSPESVPTLQATTDAESQSSAAAIREQLQDTLPDLAILAPELAKSAVSSEAGSDDAIPTLFNSGRLDVSDNAELQKTKKAEEAQRAKDDEEEKRALLAKAAKEAQLEREAEAAKKAKEAQLAKQAEEAKKAEEARLAKEAEDAKKAEEARLAKEAEAAKKAEEARLAKEAEDAKKAEEARLAKEAEEAKKAEEARLAKEAEEAKKAEEARLAKEAEDAKKAEEARLAKEAEDAKKAEEARLAKEAEDAKRALLAKAAKEAQLEREAEAAKKAKEAKEAEEAKKAKEAEEARAAKEAEEAKKALLAKAAKEAQLAREAEEAKKAQQANEAKKAQLAAKAEEAKKAQLAKQAADAKKVQQPQSADEPPEWDRDSTMAELRPDMEQLEKAVAGLAEPDAAGKSPGPPTLKPAIKPEADSLPELQLESDSTPELKDPTMPSLPKITLDAAIHENIAEATAALELHDATIADDTVSEESSEIAEGAPKKTAPETPPEPDPELMKIAANIANAKSFDEFDDQMAETLFGAELNTIAAQVLANPPTPEPANQELEAELSLAFEDEVNESGADSVTTPEPAAITPPDQQTDFEKEFKEVYGENALEVSLESKPVNTGMDLSASQRLATVRALNAENLPPGVVPPIPASSGAPSNGAAATPAPASIEDQMKTSMTSTFAALKARPSSANDDDDDDEEEEKKGGFFSRFRRS